MKILFTGVSGLLGRYFFEMNPDPSNYKIVGTSRNEWPQNCFELLSHYEAGPFEKVDRYRMLFDEFRPDVIVNAGSEGNVDAAQLNPEIAKRVNYEFPLFLVEEARRRRLKLVHFSSNAVYDGEHAPYSESSPMHPVNYYGSIKKRADEEVRNLDGDWILLRPIVAYGWNFPFGRKNPVSQFLPLMLQRKSLRLVDDQFENPIYAGDVARILWKCLADEFCGELNVGGGDGGISRFDWMKTVAEVFGCADAPLEPTSRLTFPMAAPRPRDTHYDIGKLVNFLGYVPLTVRQGAQAMLDDRQRSHLSIGA
ncbi:MAG: NAD(P)-dependent oxidoreductase [Planctomycetota bacterium]|nr:NAD(P)-dependent oxidoreductase [Planctomycetota bacterium]